MPHVSRITIPLTAVREALTKTNELYLQDDYAMCVRGDELHIVVADFTGVETNEQLLVRMKQIDQA